MNKPFWSIENDYFDAKRKLEEKCEKAKTLFDAVKAGANMTWLIDSSTGYETPVSVEYLDEEGDMALWGDFTEEQIKHINVKFDYLGEDGDGYTTAYFQKEN